jgi:hypothetical protein
MIDWEQGCFPVPTPLIYFLVNIKKIATFFSKIEILVEFREKKKRNSQFFCW